MINEDLAFATTIFNVDIDLFNEDFDNYALFSTDEINTDEIIKQMIMNDIESAYGGHGKRIPVNTIVGIKIKFRDNEILRRAVIIDKSYLPYEKYEIKLPRVDEKRRYV